MGRYADSGHVDLVGIFHQVQREMLSHLAVGELFEHPTVCGAVTERHWLDLFDRHLPERYRAASAFIVDADGRRSRQIDIAIFDRLYSPLLFPDASGLHIPAESVYAVFEVKQDLNVRLIRDAGRKAASVRRLRRTSVPVIAGGSLHDAIRPHRILAGILALRSGWPTRFHRRLPAALALLSPDESLDLGCALRDGAFEVLSDDAPAAVLGSLGGADLQVRAGSRTKRASGSQLSARLVGRTSRSASRPPGRLPARSYSLATTHKPEAVHFSTPDESLVFFMLRLLTRLRALGTAPAADLMAYADCLKSFKKP
ncbi:MAG: DUF6602 domain-containing protein [Bryobacteraceae bacterium]